MYEISTLVKPFHFVLDQYAELDFYSASSLKQQSAGRHVGQLGHIILIPSQPGSVSNIQHQFLETKNHLSGEQISIEDILVLLCAQEII
jgi:hypothetical protein